MNNKISCGGNAYHNGIMFVSDKGSVKTTRDTNNAIKFEINSFSESKIKTNNKIEDFILNIPIFRGIYHWIIKNRMYKIILIFLLLDLVAFIPTQTGSEMISLGFSMVAFIILILISGYIMFFFVKIKDFLGYHGAEHMVANTYNSNRSLTLYEVKKQPRIHERCGTMFLSFTWISFSIIYLATYNLNLFNTVRFILMFGIADELYNNEQLKKYGSRYLFKLGMWFQKYFTTRKPTDGQLEVAIECFKKLIELERVNDYQTKQ